MVVLFTAAKRKGYAYRPVFNPRMPELRGLMLLVMPIMVSNMIGEFNQIIDRNFASMLITGSVSSLNYAAKLVNTVVAVISGSIVTVLFPNLSELAAENDFDKIRHYISLSIKRLAPLLLPSALGIILLANPIVKLLLERGSFTPEDTLRTTECLRIYAVLIIISGLNGIIVRAFFALSDTKTPAIISAVSVAVNAGLNFLLIDSWQHQGLAFATVVSSVFSMVVLLVVLQRKLGSLRLFNGWLGWVKTMAALVIMGAVVQLGIPLLPLTSDSFAVSAVSTLGLVFAAVAVYIFVHFVLRTGFFRECMKVLRSLLRTVF
jgi:putative peptidoglycan lipid II flippase